MTLINKHFKITEDELRAIYELQRAAAPTQRPITETEVVRVALRGLWAKYMVGIDFPGEQYPAMSETPEQQIENDGVAGS